MNGKERKKVILSWRYWDFCLCYSWESPVQASFEFMLKVRNEGIKLKW